VRRLIVNVRGANASGKTTLVRQFLAAAARLERLQLRVDPEGAFPGRWTDGFRLELPGLALPVIVVGAYDESKYSGCDKIKSADDIETAIRSAFSLGGHVLFEGFRVSKSYARFAALRNELCRADPGLTWLWVLLHAPKELIFERAQARREDGRLVDKKELAAVVSQMSSTRDKLRQAFPGDVLTLDPAKDPTYLYLRLLGEMAARERGETMGAA
jgi:hypothetical protein